jgi:OOP family OmpA-OmpF porin
MRNIKSIAVLVALAFVITLMAAVGSSAQNASNAHLVPVALGQKLKVQGVVSVRAGDSFKVRDPSGAETSVLLTPSTKVTSHGFSKHTYPVTYIMRGLRLQAQGMGDANGNLVAEWVRFDEQDLRAAQALEQTDELAQENQARIAAEEKTRQEQTQKLAGQVAENQALTAQAQASADVANAKAEAAQKAADRANNRINGLDDYDPVRNWTIYFRPGSAVLSLAEKQKIDLGVGWVRSQPNTNGWFVEIVGFADTSGNTAANRSLSERRANAVIGYLVAKHNMPLTRLLQPFGYGDSKPASSNTTAAGRAQNRRVEIHILANKGIAGTD